MVLARPLTSKIPRLEASLRFKQNVNFTTLILVPLVYKNYVKPRGRGAKNQKILKIFLFEKNLFFSQLRKKKI